MPKLKTLRPRLGGLPHRIGQKPTTERERSQLRRDAGKKSEGVLTPDTKEAPAVERLCLMRWERPAK